MEQAGLEAKQKLSANVYAATQIEVQASLGCLVTKDCVSIWPPFGLSIRNCKAFQEWKE
jgi:hypothetical protein